MNSRGSQGYPFSCSTYCVLINFSYVRLLNTLKMGRVPPNKPSKHRKPSSKSKRTPSNQSDHTERTVDRFYSTNSLAESDHEESEMDRASTSCSAGTPLENRRNNRDAESALTIATPLPIASTSSSNCTPVAATLIPRAPGRNNTYRCLEELNLASMRNSGEAGDLVAEAFFESQRQSQEDFNNRMEQRVLEELRKERENAAPPPPKRKTPIERVNSRSVCTCDHPRITTTFL